MRHNYLYSNERHNKHFLLRILAVFLLVSMVLCGCGKVPTEKPSEAVSTKPDTNGLHPRKSRVHLRWLGFEWSDC